MAQGVEPTSLREGLPDDFELTIPQAVRLEAASRSSCGLTIEQPRGTSSWLLEAARHATGLPGVLCERVCHFGLQVDDQGLFMKPSRIMANSAGVALRLRGCVCTKDHDHVRLEGGNEHGSLTAQA